MKTETLVMGRRAHAEAEVERAPPAPRSLPSLVSFEDDSATVVDMPLPPPSASAPDVEAIARTRGPGPSHVVAEVIPAHRGLHVFVAVVSALALVAASLVALYLFTVDARARAARPGAAPSASAPRPGGVAPPPARRR